MGLGITEILPEFAIPLARVDEDGKLLGVKVNSATCALDSDIGKEHQLPPDGLRGRRGSISSVAQKLDFFNFSVFWAPGSTVFSVPGALLALGRLVSRTSLLQASHLLLQ